jgi:hypothetical protein
MLAAGTGCEKIFPDGCSGGFDCDIQKVVEISGKMVQVKISKGGNA